MKHFLTYLLFTLLLSSILCAQIYDAPLEDLDETEVESIEYALRHPVRINSASRSGLLACGLFTPLQVDNILEYRKFSGDILSVVELSLIDGFTVGDTKNITRYLDFQEGKRVRGVDADLMLRSGWKGDEWSGASMKSELSVGEVAGIYFSSRLNEDFFSSVFVQGQGNSSFPASASSQGKIRLPTSFSLAFCPGVHLEKLIIGDYSLRFGQGLGCWNGMSMTTLSSINAFMRRPTGLRQSHSLPPSDVKGTASYRRGAAADIVLKRWTFTPFVSFSDSSPAEVGMHSRFLSRSGEYGITAGGRIPLSVDFRQYFRGFDLFGEWLPLGSEPP